MKTNACAIIVAAGKGRRFRAKTPKQFCNFFGKPLFIWSVLAFKKTRRFSKIIVVLPKAYVSCFGALSKRYGFETVAGGTERIDSVRAGLAVLGSQSGLVAIHDGARPLITPRVIKQTLAAAQRYGAAVTAVKAKDTVKLSKTGTLCDKTLDRNNIWLAQTPQIFDIKLLSNSYAKAAGVLITDDSQALEISGIKPRIVEGDGFNIKITKKEDMDLVSGILKKHKGLISCL